MKQNSRSRFFLTLISFAGIVLASSLLHAADGSWGADAAGAWSAAGSWAGGIVADGANSVARFTNDVTAIRTVTLDGAHTLGGLVFDDGDTNTAGGGWIVSGANTITLSGATTPVITVNQLNNGGDPTNDVTISSVLAGTQGYIKNGAGTLNLMTANTASPARVDNGIISLGISTALGTQEVQYNGGGVRISPGIGNFTITNRFLTTGIIISSNGTYDGFNGLFYGTNATANFRVTSRFTIGNGVATTLNNFTGTFDLTGSGGSGVLRINLGSGTTPYNLTQLTLNLGSTAGRAQSRVTASTTGFINLGALMGGPSTQLTSSDQGASGTASFANWAVGFLNTSTLFEGRLRDGGVGRVMNFIKVGTGTLTLSGANDYTGTTTISNGVVALTGNGMFTASTNIAINTGMTLDVSGRTNPWTLTLPYQSLSGNGSITSSPAGSVAITNGTVTPGFGAASIGKLTFNGGLTLDGLSGTVTNVFECGTATNDQIVVNGDLTLANTINVRLAATGATIPNGTYILYSWTGNLVGDTNNLSVAFPSQPGAMFLLQDTVAKTISLQVGGVVTANLNWRGDLSANWDVATTANWRNAGVAANFANGDNVTFNDTGSNTVPVNLAAAVTPGSVTVTNSTGHDYEFATTASGKVSGTVAIVKKGTGKLTLSLDNDYSGGTVISNGTLQIGNAATAGSAGGGGIVNYGTVIYNRSDAISTAGLVSGTGSLVQAGSSTLTVAGANTYSGGTTVSNGVLLVSSYTTLGSGAVNLAGGNFTITSSGGPTTGLSNNVNVVANTTLQYNGSGTYGAVIFGTLSGANGVTLNVTHAGAGPDRLRLYGNFTNNANLNLNDAGIALAPYAATGVQLYNGVISGAGQVVMRSAGTVYLNASNTYSGGTTTTFGSLGLGVDTTSSGGSVVSGPLGTGALIPANEGAGAGGNGTIFASGGARLLENAINFAATTNDFTLILGGTNNLTLAGNVDLGGNTKGIQVDNTALSVMSGVIANGSLTKTGTGLLLLDGNNTFAGAALVNAGSLGGTGTLTAPVTIAAAAALAPGHTGIGTLTLNGGLNLSGGMVVEVNKSLAQSNDFVNVTGTLTNSGTGTITVTNLGAVLVAGDKFTLFSQAVSNGAALTITGGGVTTWSNRLALDGSIVVPSLAPPPQPAITSITINGGGNLVFTGTNGVANGNFYVLHATNINVPMSNWARLVTNQFNGSGNFNFTNGLTPGEAQQFYRLLLP